MAQHGYLGDGFGTHGEINPERDEDRERGWRDRDEDRDRRFLFGDEDREEFRDRGMSHYGREHGYGGFQGDFSRSGREQGGFGGLGDYSRGRRSFSADPDEHYRSWRDRHMAELDRDYEDYCREREQQFHEDFDAWRVQRLSSREPLRTGMTQTGLSSDPTGTEQAESELLLGTEDAQDPMATATLGTSSRTSRRGR